MFNYTILENTERVEDIYTYFDVEFSDGNETYIELNRITNDAKEMELQFLIDCRFDLTCQMLDAIIIQYGHLYDENNQLFLLKNNE